MRGLSCDERDIKCDQLKLGNEAAVLSIAAAYVKTVPNSARARPRLPRMTYFQAASREVARLYSATKSTDESAVVSKANHITPRLFAKTTSNMPAVKRGVRTKNYLTRPEVTTQAARSRRK